MKKKIFIFVIAIVGIIASSFSVSAISLLAECPNVVVKAEKQYTREEVLQDIYNQTEMWKLSGVNTADITAPNNNTKQEIKPTYNKAKWTILNNSIVGRK